MIHSSLRPIFYHDSPGDLRLPPDPSDSPGFFRERTLTQYRGRRQGWQAARTP